VSGLVALQALLEEDCRRLELEQLTRPRAGDLRVVVVRGESQVEKDQRERLVQLLKEEATLETCDGMSLTPASQIEDKPLLWLLPDFIPLGAPTLLVGRQGDGKSLLTVYWAAKLTLGNLPGEFSGKPRSAIICTTEDAWSSVVKQRLRVAGADLRRVFRVDKPDDSTFRLRDLKKLQVLIEREQVAMIILDPLISHMDADSISQQAVRKSESRSD
jgi:hypothetical protein